MLRPCDGSAAFSTQTPVPHGVTRTPARRTQRFAVYRNRVVTGLIRAVKTLSDAKRAVRAILRLHGARVRDRRSAALAALNDLWRRFSRFHRGLPPAVDIPSLATSRIKSARCALSRAGADAIKPARRRHCADARGHARDLRHGRDRALGASGGHARAAGNVEIEPAPIRDWRAGCLMLRPTAKESGAKARGRCGRHRETLTGRHLKGPPRLLPQTMNTSIIANLASLMAWVRDGCLLRAAQVLHD